MGLDYSYLLYFPRSQMWAALDGLAELADPTGEACRIDLDGAIMQLPFEAWAGTPEHVSEERLEAELNFMTVLQFAPDDQLEEFATSKQAVPPAPGAPISIGYIYLTVFTALSVRAYGETDPDLVLFQLTAATTSMSILLAESSSIRRSFERLLARHSGVCGLIDRENDGELVWWRGLDTSVELPDAWMSLAQIETFLTQRG